jgi:hypothetical protein
LSDAEGPVWHAASPDNWVRPELAEAGWVGLCSTLCRRQQTLNVSLPYRGSKGPLNLLIDSTGIKAEGEGALSAACLAIACRAMDAPMLPDLLNQIPPDQDLGSVTADGAYDTRKCHEAIAARDAHPVIPPRKNAKPWKPTSAGAIARNDAVNAQRYLGRTLWRRWSRYHRRSRVETKRNCIV